VWVLLKNGFSPLDVDIFGNTCIHQAAAGGRRDVLETFLAFGVNIDQKNNRGHQPLSLATEHSVRELIHQAMSKKSAQNARQSSICMSRDICVSYAIDTSVGSAVFYPGFMTQS
jgi:ankyrin repeat protein